MTLTTIIQGCKKNDRKYQKLFVEQYSELLLTISRRYAPDQDSAKDILQEGLIRILKYIGKFDNNKGTIETWMGRIIINTALQRYKSLRYETEKSGLENVSHQVVIPDVYALLSAEELMALIDQLPEGYKLVFNLYAIEGYSHKEIASLLGIQEASSRSQLQRARKQLQLFIKQEEKRNSYESKAI